MAYSCWVWVCFFLLAYYILIRFNIYIRQILQYPVSFPHTVSSDYSLASLLINLFSCNQTILWCSLIYLRVYCEIFFHHCPQINLHSCQICLLVVFGATVIQGGNYSSILEQRTTLFGSTQKIFEKTKKLTTQREY